MSRPHTWRFAAAFQCIARLLLCGIPPLVPANVLSWLVAVSNSYVLNSFITFARESNRELQWRTYAKFLGSGLAGLIVNTTVLVVAVGLMPRLIADPGLQLAAAKACAIMASILVNYSLSYLVLFLKNSRVG